MPKVLASYTVRIMAPDDADDEKNMEVYDQYVVGSNCMAHAEDAINDVLPDGYYAKIDDFNVDLVRN